MKFSRRDVLKLGLGLSVSPIPLVNASEKCVEATQPFKYITSIDRRPIPSTGELIPAVGLGTWRTFDAGNSIEKRQSLLEVLRNLNSGGGAVIDSSPMYGSSESVVGDLSQQLKLRSKFFFSTKVWTNGKEDGIRQMNQSFQRMKTEQMDLLEVHNLVDVETHLKTLRSWKEEGRIRYFGITHYVPAVYPEMIRIMRNEKPDFVQCCYNIRVREAERELLPFAADNGIAVLINRPFEEGDLINATNGRALPPWSAELGIATWAQFFLKYILSHGAVTCAIPGTSQAAHMKENLEAASGSFPDGKMRKGMVDYFESF